MNYLLLLRDKLGEWLRQRLIIPDRLPPPNSPVFAIAVFPFSLYKGTLGPKTMAIAERVIELCHTYNVSYVVCMGGWESQGKREGPLIAEYIADKIPQQTQIIIEDKTVNTGQQVRYLRTILPTLNGRNKNVITVAEEMHLRRVRLLTNRHLNKIAEIYYVGTKSKDWKNDKKSLTHPFLFGCRELFYLLYSELIPWV
jgi:hypothetical protein